MMVVWGELDGVKYGRVVMYLLVENIRMERMQARCTLLGSTNRNITCYAAAHSAGH